MKKKSRNRTIPFWSILVFFLFWESIVLASPAIGYEKKFRVMVVMSYEESYPWVTEVKQGIDAVLADLCTLRYLYLNTKTDRESSVWKAKEAYEAYLDFKPDGVIASDDDAQVMFVLPYLKNRVPTPVMFCGVNAEPETYGYPAANVSGVLEREPMKESLLFLTQLVPDTKTFGLIIEKSPTGLAVKKQLEQEAAQYPVQFKGTRLVTTMEEALDAVKDLKNRCDALLYITLEGIIGPDKTPLSDRQIMPVLLTAFNKPVFTNAMYRVKYGALGAVVKTGQEHGRLSSKMLLQAMNGTPISAIAITQNRFGRRILNVDALKELGIIRPKPFLIRSATLVKTEK